jgi:hypothetical protein
MNVEVSRHGTGGRSMMDPEESMSKRTFPVPLI